jgi:AcrR family transcriptional regulator
MAETPGKGTRDRILDAANKLFYSEGIRAVSVDRIAEKAGVTKRTLYYHFRSKDSLIAEYLTSRDQPNLLLFEKWFDEAQGSVADKTYAMFDRIAANARHPKWKGCGFQRTVAELASMPGHPAIAIGSAHKKKFESWLSSRFSSIGMAYSEQTARGVSLLMEGAFAAMLAHRDPGYAESARETARDLVNARLSGSRSRP